MPFSDPLNEIKEDPSDTKKKQMNMTSPLLSVSVGGDPEKSKLQSAMQSSGLTPNFHQS